MKNSLFAIISFLLGILAATAIGQESTSLLEPVKLDWAAIGNNVAEQYSVESETQGKVVNKQLESKRVSIAVKEFLNSGDSQVTKSKLDGVWKSKPGVYFVFDRDRAAQLLFLDIMSQENRESRPLVLDSKFRLTKKVILLDPDEKESRDVPFELNRDKTGSQILRINLNNEKWTVWTKVNHSSAHN